MSTSEVDDEEKKKLVRVRENQRRSRARRRDHVQELERKLRQCELQGVQASADVQVAARRVAAENTQLRHLLTRTGVSDELIAQYLQTGVFEQHDPGPTQPYGGTATPGPSVQVLQQAMAPRRPDLQQGAVAFPLPSQMRQQTPTGSLSWNSPQSVVQSPYGHSQPICAPPSMTTMAPSAPYQYAPDMFIPGATSEAPMFPGHTAGQVLDDTHHRIYDGHGLPVYQETELGGGILASPYHSQGSQGYGHHRGS